MKTKKHCVICRKPLGPNNRSNICSYHGTFRLGRIMKQREIQLKLIEYWSLQ